MENLKFTDVHKAIIHSLFYAKLEGWNPTIKNIALKKGLSLDAVKKACVELVLSEPDQYSVDNLDDPTTITDLYS